MLIHEFAAKFDSLSSEDTLFQIPLRKEFILSHVGRRKRVLDVGCSGGQISKLILDQYNDVYGVEINPVAAEEARKRGIQVEIANAEEGLPFRGGFFDVVNAGKVLEQLYDTKHFFLECRRVLKDNGVLILTTPNLNSWENRLRMLRGEYLANLGAYPEDHHGQRVRLFNLKKIEELCEQTGFRVEDVQGLFSIADDTRKSPVARTSLRIASKVAPGVSKLLMIAARKQSHSLP